MTHLLWKYYWQDDVDKFRRLLSPTAGHSVQNAAARSPNLGYDGGVSSPGSFGTSPRPSGKLRKPSGTPFGNNRHGHNGLGRSEVNGRDHAGLTILLRAASSTAENAVSFVEALLEHPATDIYAQDLESGWNALHRALYAGNISIARLLLEKERKDLTGYTTSGRVGQLIKTKDHEGNSPFDLYNSTIGERDIRDLRNDKDTDDGSDTDEAEAIQVSNTSTAGLAAVGEDLFAFGSNRNLSLGFGDEDDRQFPERVYLKRPEHLLIRFYNEYVEETGLEGPASQDLSKVPTLVLNRPLVIKDIVLAKFHSAVLTADPVSNLYMCGIGRGGRLGLGDENTRFTYTAVQGPLADRKVVQVALGQNHSMAIDDTGALWTWGSNAHCQLGYTLPEPTKKDEDRISTTPRQVFGPLKKDSIVGIAASSIHSVAHTGSSLYCWGKNIGQLALMDADSRSLELQQTPRKVAASLFPSPIVMVTAIDKATTILLQNHTVCVFTGYGYHIVKFPFAGLGSIGNLSMSNRYEPGRGRIQYITSGGETIAALTGRGDLFTMHIDHKIEANPPATSTSNPSKIKGAVTPPQCIWSARKDGVRSVGVGEHGSVIISTQSGAVWRRIKRAKAKDAYSDASVSKPKDFKFQRVPYITKVATVRASPSGAFAAIRQDSDVLKEQLSIDEQSLWKDVAPLNCLEGFRSSELDENDVLSKFWKNDDLRDKFGSVAVEVLKAQNLEVDLQEYFTNWSYRHEPLDLAVCTSTEPNLKIPVHGWLLPARSSVLRNGLAQYRKTGTYALSEVFEIGSVDGKPVVTFQGLDLISLLNLVLFLYEDKVIPAWNFTRQAPQLAYRYRQIRLEVMRLASRLNMGNLEASARLQTAPKPCMDMDFRLAAKDRRFYENGDALLELDGAEIPVHSTFLCQRCPWFEGLFHGRSAGSWLAGRRDEQDPADKVTIDLKHMEPAAFKYVLRYLYGDYGAELFDPAVCDSFDDFLDLVMEVMSIANYLMLDRLSQICQKVMGRFTNIRNVAHLLNAISPCSITEFKDAGLEYVCLQLESMLENHLLDELDEDLLLELDEVVRDNQAAHFPFSKSGRAELLLHESNPELAEEIDEERQIRVKEMAYKAHKDDDRKLSSSFKGKSAAFDDFGQHTPTSDRPRRTSKAGQNEPFSPDLRPKASQADLMFDMEEVESDSSPGDSPSLRPRECTDRTPNMDQIPSLSSSWKGGAQGKATLSSGNSPMVSPAIRLPGPGERTLGTHHAVMESPELNRDGSAWGAPAALPTSKMDLRDIIMSESTSRSALSEGLTVQKAKEAAPKLSQPKMSQKERKRQQQQQQQQAQAALFSANTKTAAWEKSPSDNSPVATAPWKLAPAAKSHASPIPTKPLVEGETTSLPIRRRTASPDTRFSGQQRTASSSSSIPMSRAPPAKTAPPAAAESLVANKPPLVPHSKTYLTPAPKAEPLLGYSLADIIGQQRREQEIVKEAVAKRSLQEIQQEQAFQEWWDAESRRTQEEEARRLERERGSCGDGKRGGGASGRRGRPGKSKGGNVPPKQKEAKSKDDGVAKGRERDGRGGGRGGAAGRGGGDIGPRRGGGGGPGKGRRDNNTSSSSTATAVAVGGGPGGSGSSSRSGPGLGTATRS
ncbi:hypothetical protein B0H66DRAFT_294883 [Apodospora peruviana]|uniref:BTB domain-containing protein n=1 Tax=Apodospora peruviana TaxID=516989 RepID=A0AAE0I0U8_9PEZI|nr:hypothetical protein B0H66DRAFT_294883 [Apodospora peruviana]